MYVLKLNLGKFQIVNAHWLEYCKKVVCQRSQGSHLTDLSRLLKHTKEEPFNRDDDDDDSDNDGGENNI